MFPPSSCNTCYFPLLDVLCVYRLSGGPQGDFIDCVCPAGNLYDTVLCIERIIGDINVTKGGEYSGQLPLNHSVTENLKHDVRVFQY